MMHFDTTMEIVTLETLDPTEAQGPLAVFATASSNLGSDSVRRKNERTSDEEEIRSSVGARSPGNVVLHERHVYEPGEYLLTSSLRTGRLMRSFRILIESLGSENFRVKIMPETTPATWIMGNYDPVKVEGTLVTIQIESGRIASIETGEGRDQRRLTAWEQLGEDLL